MFKRTFYASFLVKWRKPLDFLKQFCSAKFKYYLASKTLDLNGPFRVVFWKSTLQCCMMCSIVKYNLSAALNTKPICTFHDFWLRRGNHNFICLRKIRSIRRIFPSICCWQKEDSSHCLFSPQGNTHVMWQKSSIALYV